MRKYIELSLFVLFGYLLLVPDKLCSQEEMTENFMGFGFHYGIDIPAGDLADRFGQNFHAGMSLELFRKKLKGMLRLEAKLYFGPNVKEDVLAGLRSPNGAILGNNGNYVDVFLRQRGNYIGILANKIIKSSAKNKNSGLALGLGLGLMQHNIRFQVDSENAPQITDEYAKGYDRHSMGPSLKQNISYLHLGNNKNLNYEISLYFIEAFTKNTRPIDFDTGIKDERNRLDIFIGLDVKWIIPLKDARPAEEIFY